MQVGIKRRYGLRELQWWQVGVTCPHVLYQQTLSLYYHYSLSWMAAGLLTGVLVSTIIPSVYSQNQRPVSWLNQVSLDHSFVQIPWGFREKAEVLTNTLETCMGQPDFWPHFFLLYLCGLLYPSLKGLLVSAGAFALAVPEGQCESPLSISHTLCFSL